MRVLVLSHRHGLLPLAHRLVREGAQVDVVVWQHDFERAWEGLLPKALSASAGTLTPEGMRPWVDAVSAGECVLVTDVPQWRELFPEAPLAFPMLAGPRRTASYMHIGGWFDGEAWSLRHALLVDQGAWQGGLGPALAGAATLVRVDQPQAVDQFDLLAAATRDVLKSQSVRGLVLMAVDAGDVTDVVVGWPWLATAAWLSELESLSALLVGAQTRLASKYVTVVPVSVPPWPNPGRAPQRAVGGLTPQQQGRVFWHDVVMDTAGRRLATAGLDGLVGVARGAAESVALAQGRALEVALRIVLDEKQFRPDAGGLVAQELARLENEAGVVL